MEKELKKRLVKSIFIYIFAAMMIFLVFNGFGRHPYRPEELEDVFLAKTEEQKIKGLGQETLISETYGNSMTFLLETEDGERACATYIRSVFFDRYKEYKFYSGVNGVLGVDEITYAVNDGAMFYELTLHFGENPSITDGDKVTPIMHMKFIALCIIAMGIFGSRIFFGRRK